MSGQISPKAQGGVSLNAMMGCRAKLFIKCLVSGPIRINGAELRTLRICRLLSK